MTENNLDYDVTAVTGKSRGDGEVPHAQLLCDFAEAVSRRHTDDVAKYRHQLVEQLGSDALIDAAATVAAFHGNVRVADSTGIPPEKAAAGQVTDKFRAEMGIDQFYKLKIAAQDADRSTGRASK